MNELIEIAKMGFFAGVGGYTGYCCVKFLVEGIEHMVYRILEKVDDFIEENAYQEDE